MGGFEDCMARDVVDIAARRDADATHLRSQGIRQVVAVQVEGRDDIEFLGACQHLL